MTETTNVDRKCTGSGGFDASIGVELLDIGVTQRQSLARNHRGPYAIPRGTRGGDAELSDAFEE
jgi:hypothetical protein